MCSFQNLKCFISLFNYLCAFLCPPRNDSFSNTASSFAAPKIILLVSSLKIINSSFLKGTRTVECRFGECLKCCFVPTTPRLYPYVPTNALACSHCGKTIIVSLSIIWPMTHSSPAKCLYAGQSSKQPV